MSIYNHPAYYDIAFDFVNVREQVDFFEKLISVFSGVRVRNVLDIGCGPGKQLIEFARRGYRCTGLDINERMLHHLRKRAEEEGVEVETVKADMNNFELRKKFDFAFILMGTIGYVKSNEEMLSHLKCVGRVLRKGGLYVIENFLLDWRNAFRKQTWKMRRKGIEVRATYRLSPKNLIEQLAEEELVLEIKEKGKIRVLRELFTRKLIFPQEFLLLPRFKFFA